ncbi:MAG: acetyl-CoA acetyltransferase [Acidimicrobiia bacterium]|nr:MAG: acetyl-CoA acetyltransferase [Acidimicrobiia bacterium]
MGDVFVVDAVRTPVGRLGGKLAHVRPDDLAAHAIASLVARHPSLEPSEVADVVWGAANQAGEDNRNVARMAALLAGLGEEVPGVTVNRLCGSGLQAVAQAAQALRDGWGNLMIAGGSESMSRAPFVLAKPDRAFPTGAPEVADTTLGWRLVNPRMRQLHGCLAMGETAEEVARLDGIGREEQDLFALESHRRAVAAQEEGRFREEIVPIEAPQDHRGRVVELVDTDEGPRKDTSLEALARLRPVFREGGTVTAGNASPMNDGAAAVLLATEEGLRRFGLTPMARIVASAVAGVHPDIMGIGPVPATRKALARAGSTVDDLDLVELNEAFAAQSLACIRRLGLDPAKVNVNGGAIALGHPLGCSGARILTTLVHEMRRRGARHGLATMCIGVGQGIALVVEGV